MDDVRDERRETEPMTTPTDAELATLSIHAMAEAERRGEDLEGQLVASHRAIYEAARSEASGAWIPPAQARDGTLYACVYTDGPLVAREFLVFANGEWWEPNLGHTCDEPDLMLELPALPGAPHE